MIKTFSLFILSLSLHHFLHPCFAANNCSAPSACGLLPNISSPFRLKNDPSNCGDPMFELSCKNDVASMHLNSQEYYVKEIKYGFDGCFDNTTIRIVDASINSDDVCSFPSSSSYAYNFTSDDHPYYITDHGPAIYFITCQNPLNTNYSQIDARDYCASKTGRHAYIKVGRMNASELQETCELEAIMMTSWEFEDPNNVSLSEIHESLLYGFELTVCPNCVRRPSKFWDRFRVFFYTSIVPTLLIITGLLLAMICPPVLSIIGFFAISILLFYNGPPVLYMSVEGSWDAFSLNALVITIIICAPRLIIFPLAMRFLIYKLRTKRFSIFEAIESFLQSDNKLTTIRYSNSDIKKMTRGFQDKLGEGGYGSVYKGKLRSGHHVAVKLLGESGGKGQDFINEIATIGRIHHVNVVKLVGYCAQGSKRALVYDFMPNGSLEKYLFNREEMNSLDWDKKFEIAVGVARGIEYLHRGCDIQILHFDIKPHNILLDDKFNAKISDFGLAKFFFPNKETVTMTAARGTIGYVAPELISRSIGDVSYKADVYSFGMLLIEMVGLKRDLMIRNPNDSTQYFPNWIYECFEQGRDIDIGKANEKEDNDSTRKLARKVTIVALWCIQMSPGDRPSMSQVLQMLEGDVGRLRIPKYLSPSAHIEMHMDETETISCSSDFVSLHVSN